MNIKNTEVWTDWPRVITYARRHQNAFFVKNRQDLLRNNGLDTLAIETKVKDRQKSIHVVNLYKAI